MSEKRPKASRKGGYIRLWNEILDSPAWSDLTPAARSLLIELLRIYRPSRQSNLSIEVRKAAQLLKVHKDTAARAFTELAEHGFIALSEGALWQQRMARTWRITFEPCANGAEPTDDWRKWKPGEPVATLPRKTKPVPKRRDRLSGSKGQAVPNEGTDTPQSAPSKIRQVR